MKKNIKNVKIVKQKIYFGTISRLFLLIFLIIFFTLIGMRFIRKGFVIITSYDLSYEEKSNIDYKVYLKENIYFNKEYLEKDLEYVASLIKYINVYFDYTFKSSDIVNYEYKYYITGTIIVTKPEEKKAILYKKEYILLDEQIIKKDNINNFKIKENINIDYDKYNNLINSFKSEYALSTDSKLIIQLYVITNGDYKEFKNSIINKSVMELTIPLSEKTISINMDYSEVNNTNKITEKSKFELINIIYFIFGGIFILIDIYLLIKYFNFIHKLVEKTPKYTKIVRRILREYDRIITTVKNMPDLSVYKIVNVINFEELVDTSERIEKPILFCEIHKNQKCQFVVLDKNIAYQFIIKAVDLGER